MTRPGRKRVKTEEMRSFGWNDFLPEHRFAWVQSVHLIFLLLARHRAGCLQGLQAKYKRRQAADDKHATGEAVGVTSGQGEKE